MVIPLLPKIDLIRETVFDRFVQPCANPTSHEAIPISISSNNQAIKAEVPNCKICFDTRFALLSIINTDLVISVVVIVVAVNFQW